MRSAGAECKCRTQNAERRTKLQIPNTYYLFTITYYFKSPSPTIDEPTHPFSIQAEGSVYHQRSCISSRASVHIITAGAYHQRSCIKTERKRSKAKPSDFILYSLFFILLKNTPTPENHGNRCFVIKKNSYLAVFFPVTALITRRVPMVSTAPTARVIPATAA